MVIFSLLNQSSNCYQSSRVGPQQGFFCLMLPAPVVPDEVLRLGNKRKLCSLIKEWRGESASSRARALLTGCGRGCFTGTTSWGGVGFSLGSRCLLLRLQLLVWGPGSLHTVPQLTCRAAFSHQELWSEVPDARLLHMAPHEQVKKVRLYYPNCIFIPWELFMGFAGDKTLISMVVPDILWCWC